MSRRSTHSYNTDFRRNSLASDAGDSDGSLQANDAQSDGSLQANAPKSERSLHMQSGDSNGDLIPAKPYTSEEVLERKADLMKSQVLVSAADMELLAPAATEVAGTSKKAPKRKASVDSNASRDSQATPISTCSSCASKKSRVSFGSRASQASSYYSSSYSCDDSGNETEEDTKGKGNKGKK